MFETYLIQLLIVCLKTFSEIEGRVCMGLDQAPGYSISDNRSNHLTKIYKDCKVVHKSVEIVDFSDPIDPTFLDSIEEVHGYIFIQNTGLTELSMKNLRLVRGIKLFKNRSIHVLRNKRLKNVVFPSLKEVVTGTVHIENNEALCHMDSILWEDITYREENTVLRNLATSCPPCQSGCPFCWTENICQTIWRKSCDAECPTGCLNGTSTCCENECLSGCTDNPKHCVDCRNFKDKNLCMDQCPGEKFHYGVECLEKCPDDTVHHQRSCLLTCPANHYVTETAVCKECPVGEECPKVCSTSLGPSNHDIFKKLENCTIIDGPLLIYKHMVEHENFSVSQLEKSLSKIREVTERVVVQGKHDNLTNLYFFRNLEIVKGLKKSARALVIGLTFLTSLNLTKLRKVGAGDLRIFQNDYLESLDLISLTEVGGQIRVTNNSKLCYIENSTFEGISNNVVVEHNRNPEECRKENKVCDKECKGGCWGPGNGLCRFCKHFKFEGNCVPFCDLNISFDAGNKLCKKCHSECHGCSGEGPENCTICKNLKEGNKCVEKCSFGNYLLPDNNSCLPCHPFCKNGCTGPSSELTKGGCNNCHILSWKNKRCLQHGITACDNGSYAENKILKVFDANGLEILDTVKSCLVCDPVCRSCHGRGTSVDVCDCLHVRFGKVCQPNCPSGYYVDLESACQECHAECDICYGPRNDTCHTCKNVKIYLEKQYNETEKLLHKQDFYCNSSCPSEMTTTEEFLGEGIVQRACRFDSQYGYSLSSITKNPKMLTGILVVGGLGLLAVVIVIVAIMRIQKARAEINKAKLEAHMKSMEAYAMGEIVTPTNVRPDLASIRLIKELELERGETIGSGAFGTVYRGIWRPEDENIKVAVAIKVLTEGSSSAQHKELLEEARVMASVNHQCCIRILAVCLSRQMMLITPLVVHGSLLDYVRKRGSSIGSHTMLKWSTQIARGMNYLEQKGIVHRDLAARNILVRDINQVKITDFGLAKLLTKEDSFLSTGGKVPVKWLALESIQHRIFTHKSDVWSYGVTLWELYTYGRRPYEDISALDVAAHLENGERLPQPSICTIDVYMILFKCWEVDVASRPTFLELEMQFDAMTQDSKRYLIIPGDRQRIPSDFIEDQRSELLRQVRLSDSEDFVCGEDYLDPVFSFPKRLSSKKKPSFLAKVAEEEETNFQTSPEYFNSTQASSRPSLEHQPSSHSSGSTDGTLSHLVAASAALEENRSSKSSDRYLFYPNEPNTKKHKSSLSDEKELLESQKFYENGKCKQFENFPPNIDTEGYLEPSSKSQQNEPTALFVYNPEYMEQNPEEDLKTVLGTKTSGMTKDLPRTTFGNKTVLGPDHYNEFSDPESKIVEGITYIKRDFL